MNENKNKSGSVLIYASVWFILVLAQTLILSGNGRNAAFWQSPTQYYSVWMVDLYLIALFYANYYFFTSYFIRQKLFRQYIWLSLVAAAIGLLLPVIFYYAFHWTLPGTEPNTVPFSALGGMGVIAVMALGLAVRGVSEWIKVSEKNKVQAQEILNLKNLITDLQKNVNLQTPLPLHPTSSMDIPTATSSDTTSKETHQNSSPFISEEDDDPLQPL